MGVAVKMQIFSKLTLFLIQIAAVVFYSKAPNTISLNSIFTTPKDYYIIANDTPKPKLFNGNFDLLTNKCSLLDFETNKNHIQCRLLAVLKLIKDTNRFDKYSKRVC